MNLKCVAIALAVIGMADAQLQIQTPVKPEFDVASVKPNKSDNPRSANFPLGSGNVYNPNGGFFSATNQPLITYIFFAYKIDGNQGQHLKQQLPAWMKTERFDIQARAEGNPDKDQMRLMMRSLLADRFRLAIHYETREVPVLAFVLSKRGKTGPQLQPHPGDSPCPTSSESYHDETVAGGFPLLCGGLLWQSPGVPGRTRRGARNVTMSFIADALSGDADLGRPIIDQTGLSGTFDFTLEWTPEIRGPVPQGADSEPDSSGTTFQEALQEQLGLKLDATKALIRVLVVDHIERPSEN